MTTRRDPREGETCDCGRPAIVVYITTDANGETREVPYCGIPDGGAKK